MESTPLTPSSPERPSYYQTVEELLLRAQVAIDNGLETPEIITGLSEFNFGQDDLNQGRKLYTVANSCHIETKKEFGEQIEASKAEDIAQAAALKAYKKALRIGRIVFKDQPDVAKALMLTGRRKKGLADILSQMDTFYTNLLANESFLTQMGKRGYTKEKLQREYKLVKELRDANAKQEREMGDVQLATVKRDEALDALDEWMDLYEELAEIAFEDNPQMLEKLGFTQRSAS